VARPQPLAMGCLNISWPDGRQRAAASATWALPMPRCGGLLPPLSASEHECGPRAASPAAACSSSSGGGSAAAAAVELTRAADAHNLGSVAALAVGRQHMLVATGTGWCNGASSCPVSTAAAAAAASPSNASTAPGGGGANCSAVARCAPCARGRWQAAGAGIAPDADCRPCAPGTFPAAGLISALGEPHQRMRCVPCPAGRASLSLAAARWDPHRVAAPNHTAAALSAAAACTLCAPGRYAALGSARCAACARGFFAEVGGRTNAGGCTACAPGRHSSALAASNASTCAPCPAGRYSTPSALSPLGAPPGGAAVSCTACPLGRALASAGSGHSLANCSSCPRGRYGDSWPAEGATLCRGCAAGWFLRVPPRGGGAAAAVRAAAGVHAPCEPCSTGRWSDAEAAWGLDEQQVCLRCPAGRFSLEPGARALAGCSLLPEASAKTSGGGGGATVTRSLAGTRRRAAVMLAAGTMVLWALWV
jgi:hypothetical protein